MQGDARVIELLNEQLTSELTAINQYFLHAKMQENWGYTKLAAYTRSESIDEMRHAETLTDRILYLEGLPNYQRLDRKSTRLNSSHANISYAVFCLKKKKNNNTHHDESI